MCLARRLFFPAVNRTYCFSECPLTGPLKRSPFCRSIGNMLLFQHQNKGTPPFTSCNVRSVWSCIRIPVSAPLRPSFRAPLASAPRLWRPALASGRMLEMPTCPREMQQLIRSCWALEYKAAVLRGGNSLVEGCATRSPFLKSLLPNENKRRESPPPPKKKSPSGVLWLGVAGLGLDPAVDSLLFSIGLVLESGSPLIWSKNCSDCNF